MADEFDERHQLLEREIAIRRADLDQKEAGADIRFVLEAVKPYSRATEERLDPILSRMPEDIRRSTVELLEHLRLD